MTKQELRTLLAADAPKGLADAMIAQARPGIRLTPTPTPDDEIPVGASKFGGAPDLPPNAPWPESPSGPMAFLAQINLADASRFDRTGLLPKFGIVSFFYQWVDGPWGFDPNDRAGFRVHYSPATEAIERRNPPEGAMGAEYEETMFEPCAITFTTIDTVPSFYELQELEGFDTEAVGDLSGEIWGPQGESETQLHQILGHAYTIQSPFIATEAAAVTRGADMGGTVNVDERLMAQAEADAQNWVLLLQLDTDDRPSWMWGDMGLLYFLIHKDALVRLDFSNAWCILQCG